MISRWFVPKSTYASFHLRSIATARSFAFHVVGNGGVLSKPVANFSKASLGPALWSIASGFVCGPMRERPWRQRKRKDLEGIVA